MLNILRALFGKARRREEVPKEALERSFGRLNQVAPLKSTVANAPRERAGAPRQTSSFVCREVVLDRQERIAGYEFSLHRRLHPRLKYKSILARKVYDDALIRELGSVGVGGLLGHRLAFVDLGPASFTNPQLADLPGRNSVLLLDPQEGEMDSAQVLDSLTAVKAAGFRVGCKLRPEMEMPPLVLDECAYIQVLTPGFNGVQIKELVRKLNTTPRSAGERPPSLIASEVESYDDFQLCYRAGFDYFQGRFVTTRENWRRPKSDVDRARVFHILNQLRRGAENAVLADALRREPVLTFKLLRYINSPAIGLQREITSVDQALVILGREKFYRWLSLLLFDLRQRNFAERALIEQALVRARMMECLGAGNPHTDLLFLTGMLSALSQLLGQTMSEMLAQIVVPADIRDALLRRQGPYAPFLTLAETCESGDQEEIATAAAACGVDAATVNAHLLASLNWAHQMTEITE